MCGFVVEFMAFPVCHLVIGFLIPLALVILRLPVGMVSMVILTLMHSYLLSASDSSSR
jgi:hypothetical protein